MIRSPSITDGKPVPAVPILNCAYGGAVWRFSNTGNRAAFAASPDVYMPQYGGYDPLGVARGVAVAGNPNVWLIAGEELFLFYDRRPAQQVRRRSGPLSSGQADRKWPDRLSAGSSRTVAGLETPMAANRHRQTG